MYTKLTSICTTRSLIVLASLFSSIILSNPNALVEFLKERLRECVDDDDECVDPSRLGVGVLDLDDNVGVWVSLGRGASGAVSLWMGEGVDTNGWLFEEEEGGESTVWDRALVAAWLVGVDGLAATHIYII